MVELQASIFFRVDSVMQRDQFFSWSHGKDANAIFLAYLS